MTVAADAVFGGLAVSDFRPSEKDAPVIVLLSSLGVSRRSWAGVGPILGREYRCLAVDIPGHGGSEPAKNFMTIEDFAEAVAAMLDRAGIRDAILVGNSMGATIATELAVTRPDLVSQLVHVGSAVWDSEEGRRQWLHSRSSLFCRPDGTLFDMTEDFVVNIFGAYDAAHHLMLKEDQAAAGPRLASAMWAIYAYDTLIALGRLSQPVLAVFGENDPYRTQTLPLLRQTVARLDEVVIPGGGHLLPVDRATELAACILAWLRDERGARITKDCLD